MATDRLPWGVVLRRLPLFLLACALSLAFTATASANLLDVIAADYTDDGKLNPCKYTEKDLKKLKGLIPNDLAAYDAGFSPAIDDALARRAEGACNKSKPKADGGGATTAPTGGGGGSAAPPTPSGDTGTAAPSTATAAPNTPAAAQPPPTPKAQPTPAPAVATQRHDRARGTDHRPGDRRALPRPRARDPRRAVRPRRPDRRARALAGVGARLGRQLPPRSRRGRMACLLDVGRVHRLREVRPLAVRPE